MKPVWLQIDTGEFFIRDLASDRVPAVLQTAPGRDRSRSTHIAHCPCDAELGTGLSCSTSMVHFWLVPAFFARAI
jgi:hypothetical protein